jgi:hypothetical protein
MVKGPKRPSDPNSNASCNRFLPVKVFNYYSPFYKTIDIYFKKSSALLKKRLINNWFEERTCIQK